MPVMTTNEAIRWAEKLAGEAYSEEEWATFLTFLQSADARDLDRVLEAYYQELGRHEYRTGKVSPDFIERLKMLRPVEEEAVGQPGAGEGKTGHRYWLWAAAAAVILLLIVSRLSLFHAASSSHPQFPTLAVNDRAPGRNKAILTLADGKQIALDDNKQNDIGQPGGVKIVKLDSDILSYSTGMPVAGNAVVSYNTVSTPRGGQYQIILPDGSHVWLNSASSIRFPTQFTEGHRTVQLSGEGYFEVVKDKARPFVVSVNDMQVKVLGTHFNIMAYTDEEAIKTTLLQGSVAVEKGTLRQVIVPGQQASLKKGTGQLDVSNANIDEVIAWKDGKFRFEEMDIYAIMRQIGRWYDVRITYAGDLSDIRLSGVVPRKRYASELLNALEMTKRVHFEMDGDRIVVSPYPK
jgi:ferric-dicitrate binding protein FerR (iron transport regulator)